MNLNDKPAKELTADELIDEIRSRVFDSLQNALNNGYDFKNDRAENIADDLGTYDSDFEDVNPAFIVPFIKEWKLMAK